MSPGAAKVLDRAPLHVVLDPTDDAVGPVPLGHDHVGQDEAVVAAVAVVQKIAGL